MNEIAEQLLGHTAESPQTAICVLFVLYKSLLLAVAFSAPGPGYDTSTQLSGFPELGALGRLVRWDAIWFTGLAQQGYKWEQGWAFGWGYTRLLSLGQSLWPDASYDSTAHREAVVGVVVSHVSHLLGALLLYRLSLIVFRRHGRGERIAFVTACLHVLSPAGIFLSAPYTEAPFLLLHFGAYFVYASAYLDGLESGSGGGGGGSSGTMMMRDAQIVLSGALLGVSCLFRSNGLFSGVIFFMDAVQNGLRFLRCGGGYSRLQNLAATGVAGLLIAAGQVYPQYLAYLQYCTDRNPMEKRPWCSSFPPSVYSYVQKKFWYNGLFAYWSVNAIPLFIMAAPLLTMIYMSSWWVWTLIRGPAAPQPLPEERQPLAGTSRSAEAIRSNESSPQRHERTVDTFLMLRFAIPQFLVATVCAFYANVQIITRVSSAYPVWYWWLASWIVDQSSGDGSAKAPSRWPGIIVNFCVIYGIIQAGLFAEFLPPA